MPSTGEANGSIRRDSLVDVRLRQFERVLNQLEMRIAFFGQQNLHDIKTKNDIGIVQQAQPGETAFRDAHLFLSIDRFDRPPEIFATARFHFDEDERVAVAANDVDLASAARAEIPVKNFVTVAPQKSAGQFLPARAATEMFRQFLRAREAVAPPARKSGDGSDRVQIHEVW